MRRVHSLGMIHSTCNIQSSWISGKVNLGAHTQVCDDVRMVGEIYVDEWTSIFGPNTQLYCRLNPIHIGKYCSIARGVTFQEYNHNIDSLTSFGIHAKILKDNPKKDVCSKGGIEVGNDVWIGAQSIILSGASIGDGCVVAANSVVSKYLPPYSIVAGSPAKVVRYRFDEETIELLLKLKWWDKDVEWIKCHRDLFSGAITAERVRKVINDK